MEIELKFICENPNAIKDKALKMGFIKSEEKHQIDSYFIVNEETSKGRVYFRLREDKLNGGVSLDYHTVVSELETEEVELNVKNKEAALKLLEKLGFTPLLVVDKKREEYKRENITLTFDHVDKLGSFVEIETEGTATEEIKRKMFNVSEELGLKQDKRIRNKGYPDLLKSKNLSMND